MHYRIRDTSSKATSSNAISSEEPHCLKPFRRAAALSPLSVNMVLFTVKGAISPVCVNVYTNGRIYPNWCYIAFLHTSDLGYLLFVVQLGIDSTDPQL